MYFTTGIKKVTIQQIRDCKIAILRFNRKAYVRGIKGLPIELYDSLQALSEVFELFEIQKDELSLLPKMEENKHQK